MVADDCAFRIIQLFFHYIHICLLFVVKYYNIAGSNKALRFWRVIRRFHSNNSRKFNLMWHGSEKTVCRLIFCIIALITAYCLEVMNGSCVEKKRPVFRQTPKICSECTSPHNTQVIFIAVYMPTNICQHLRWLHF